MGNIAYANSASGMMFQYHNLGVITDDISNAQTPGFKEHILLGTTMGYYSEKAPGSLANDTGAILPAGLQWGMGVKEAAVVQRQTQGVQKQTGRASDLMIKGSGYFQVQLPSGAIAYTRNGSYERDSVGALVTSQGLPLLPNLTIPPNAVSWTVNQSGQLSVFLPGTTEPTVIGQLQLATFANPDGLDASPGDDLLLQTPASGPPIVANPGDNGMGTVHWGYVEGSNVNSVGAVVRLVEANRAYEMNVKGFKAAEEMDRALANIGV
jgi:flagellar basal-body rod protein FlgG